MSWNARYFNPRYWSRRYWAKVGLTPIVDPRIADTTPTWNVPDSGVTWDQVRSTVHTFES